jgi:hypothetical protein
MDRKCFCGSGQFKYALTDSRGIFCTYVCEACEDEKRAKYNPAIFGSASQYDEATQGEQIEGDEPLSTEEYFEQRFGDKTYDD